MSRELDAEVAEKVMGIRVDYKDWACGVQQDSGGYEAALSKDDDSGLYPERGPVTLAYGFAEAIPFYSTDIAAAWQVVERISKWGIAMHTPDGAERGLGIWRCIVATGPYSEGSPDVVATAKTPAEAICLAALAAVKEVE